jgi:hypothetical protein
MNNKTIITLKMPKQTSCVNQSLWYARHVDMTPPYYIPHLYQNIGHQGVRHSGLNVQD